MFSNTMPSMPTKTKIVITHRKRRSNNNRNPYSYCKNNWMSTTTIVQNRNVHVVIILMVLVVVHVIEFTVHSSTTTKNSIQFSTWHVLAYSSSASYSSSKHNPPIRIARSTSKTTNSSSNILRTESTTSHDETNNEENEVIDAFINEILGEHALNDDDKCDEENENIMTEELKIHNDGKEEEEHEEDIPEQENEVESLRNEGLQVVHENELSHKVPSRKHIVDEDRKDEETKSLKSTEQASPRLPLKNSTQHETAATTTTAQSTFTAMDPLPRPRPPNGVYKFFLRQGLIGHILVMILVLLSELCSRYVSPLAHAVHFLLDLIFPFQLTNASAGGSGHDSTTGTILVPNSRTGLSRRQQRETLRRADQAAIQQLQRLNRSTRYQYVSQDFCRRHRLGQYKLRTKTKQLDNHQINQDRRTPPPQQQQQKQPTQLENLETTAEDDETWVLQALVAKSPHTKKGYSLSMDPVSLRRPTVSVGVHSRGPSLSVDFRINTRSSDQHRNKIIQALSSTTLSGKKKRNYRPKSVSRSTDNLLGKIRAAANTDGILSRSLLGAYPADAVPPSQAADSRGVRELAQRYGYGDWSDSDSSSTDNKNNNEQDDEDMNGGGDDDAGDDYVSRPLRTKKKKIYRRKVQTEDILLKKKKSRKQQSDVMKVGLDWTSSRDDGENQRGRRESIGQRPSNNNRASTILNRTSRLMQDSKERKEQVKEKIIQDYNKHHRHKSVLFSPHTKGKLLSLNETFDKMIVDERDNNKRNELRRQNIAPLALSPTLK